MMRGVFHRRLSPEYSSETSSERGGFPEAISLLWALEIQKSGKVKQQNNINKQIGIASLG